MCFVDLTHKVFTDEMGNSRSLARDYAQWGDTIFFGSGSTYILKH